MKTTIIFTTCLLALLAGGMRANAQRTRNLGATDPTAIDPALTDPAAGRTRTRTQPTAGQYDPNQFTTRTRGGGPGGPGATAPYGGRPVYYGAPRFGTNGFDIIDANNIFNPNRVPPRIITTNPPVIPYYTFTLNGAMSYGDQAGKDRGYAFFYGNAATPTKGYEVAETINGFKISEITNNIVKLTDTNNQVFTLKLGSGFSRTGTTNQWKFLAAPEPVVRSSSSDTTDETEEPGPNSDIAARLKARRQAEEQGTSPADAAPGTAAPGTDSTPTTPPANAP